MPIVNVAVYICSVVLVSDRCVINLAGAFCCRPHNASENVKIPKRKVKDGDSRMSSRNIVCVKVPFMKSISDLC